MSMMNCPQENPLDLQNRLLIFKGFWNKR